VTALALGRGGDDAAARRLALTALGVSMAGGALHNAKNMRDNDVKKEVAWGAAVVNGAVGALCLFRGVKEGLGK
jgi:hypothetical protein